MAHHKAVEVGLVLLLAGAVWLSTSVEAQCTCQLNVDATYRIHSGNMLIDEDNNYVLSMQWDCNLVLYEPRKNGAALWSSGTDGKGSGCYATMQIDGRLAIYDSGNTFVWATDSFQSDPKDCMYNALLQKDGNLVIYCDVSDGSDQTTHAIWSTGTAGQ